MFRSTINKGFQMTFENDWTISVQFGYGNYCDNRHHPDGLKLHQQQVVECNDAEIAIWDKHGVYYDFGSDTVKAYTTTNEVAEWIDKVSKW